MKLKRYQRGYLGAADPILEERASFRCQNVGGDLPPPFWRIGNPDDNLTTGTGSARQKPKTADLDDTRALVLYTNPGQQTLYYRVATVGADGQATWGAEQTLLSGVGFISSWGLCHIRDDKVLITYRHATGGSNIYCDVGTVDGAGNMTFATPTVVGAASNADSGRNWFELVQFDDGKAVLSGVNTSTQNTVQVVVADVFDVITFGTAALSTSASKATPKVAKLSITEGVLCSGGSSTNVSATTEHFTLSGTTATMNGTEYGFTNDQQYPPPINDQFFIGDAVGIGITADQFVLAGGSTVVDGAATTHGLTSMVVGEAAGVLTSLSALQDLTSSSFAASPTAVTMSVENKNGFLTMLASTAFGPSTIHMVRHTQASPPVYIDHTLVASNTSLTHPDQTLVGADRSLNVWTESDGVNTWVAANGVFYN